MVAFIDTPCQIRAALHPGAPVVHTRDMSDDTRKLDHLRLCTALDPSPVLYPPDRTTLLECVEPLPDRFPLVAPEDVDTSAVFLGTRVAAPVFVSAMTGGPVRSGEINRALARVCQRMGLALALGSGRPMLEDEARADSFDVRDEAPDIPIMANIGLAQVGLTPVERLAWMVQRCRADALVVHVNFAMEALQPEGDRQPVDVTSAITRLRRELGHPVIVKEVGNGFTRKQLGILAGTGIEHIDVAGAGGTSWVRLEGLRSDKDGHALAETFSRWGMPTAACLGWARQEGIEGVLASGGIRTGLDVARAMMLGARMAGMALPLVRALDAQGEEGLERHLSQVLRELRLAAHLTGCTRTADLASVPHAITEPLRTWLASA